jgi:hypothetical protein
MKTQIHILIFALVFLGIMSCEDDGAINRRTVVGTGPIITKNLDLSTFSGITATGVANINVSIGSPQAVILKAQQNIIDVLTYEVVNNTLNIGIKKNISIDNSEEIKFDITIPAITKIELTGVGDFLLSGSDQEELTIILTGVGNVHAFNMKAATCDITTTGVGNCEVNVIDNLDVIISGVGNVYYKGKPVIKATINGLGQLIDSNK